jgi:lipopolysaccharide transport system ATP-binding protein
MSKPIITVENLCKSYILKHQNTERYTALRDVIANKAKSIFNSQSSTQNKPSKEKFWALNDVSFDVNQGDRIGIIGRNGAGKSTLLKILSRIVTPTTGRITIEGRVASLLEVGTGFHPELTGRENIFLNGSILGMSRSEIKSKFDEIVAFSEVERFLDTPVKRYSSGMYVRLAFAVAAHLDPEILIVDEVLAVGDAEFQKKCLGKMKDVSGEGRTVLFVTHNMAALSALCNISILLEEGKLIGMDTTSNIVNTYLHRSERNTGETIDNSPAPKGAKLKIRSVKVLNQEYSSVLELNNANKGYLEIGFEVLEKGRGYDVSMELIHLQYGSIFTSCLKDIDCGGNDSKVWDTGYNKFIIELPLNYLREGDYVISAAATIPKVEVLDVYKFETMFSIIDSVSPVAKTTEGRNGAVLPVLEWKKINN